MNKYTGNMNFAEYFSYLNMKKPSHQFYDCDSEILNCFLSRFSDIKLPSAYVEFMRYAGSGNFWIGSDCSFDDVPKLREWADELLEENSFPCKLKEDDFVFWMHQGYMFYFFNLSEGDDPPVYYYSEAAEISSFVKCSDSFTSFIIRQGGQYRHESE
ncbi:MAG TPA: SMI1/KNR4 family protein [Ruminococcus sp.]|nr:SMI1/KNR4 family protein [Ruminococcus sp.]